MIAPSDTKLDGRQARVSGGKSWWLQCGVLGAASALVIGVYSYAARSGVLESYSLNAADTYYNLLVQGFRAGQLNLKKEAPPALAQLADPYDPSANSLYLSASYRMFDLSYYKGRLYLYFGVTPGVILFWPYTVLTSHYLFHRQAVVIFCSLGFLASAGLLRALWRRYFSEVGIGVVAACALGLGFATGAPVLASQSDVYEVPISCGYMLTMLALAALWCAFHESEPRKCSVWLAAASAAYGLAVGARPSLLLSAVILLVPVAQAWREPRQRKSGLLVAVTGPIILIGLGLMLYNAMRFDSPFEFGMRYQLAPERMDTGQYFSLRHLWFNVRVYFLEPVRWSSRFPFARKIVVPPLPPGHHGAVGNPFGILPNVPLVWLALATPLAWRAASTEGRRIFRWFVATVAVLVGICALTISLYFCANVRYEMDFLPALVLLAVVGILGLEHALAERPVWRWAARWGWGLLLVFSVTFNLLVSVENYAEACCFKGNALLHAGRIEEAMARYEQTIRIMPDYAEAHNNLGVTLAQIGRFEDAIVQFEQALRIKPDYADAHYDLGDTLLRLGRVQEAISHFEQALRISPDYAEAQTALARLPKVQ